jgi:hypothetical protein
VQQRRRGAELEDTLLRAAWDELAETGYAGLTMEGAPAQDRLDRAADPGHR